ncbi:hypothetical protein NC653_039975 [Populus alba x Populus x berolinensis]|uniref:Uncharacterized protein n=1 Tax=Populus alba x Populus x berolinensis TaxID=444605 RepID=A0AAD6LCL5_9ROSI|nr:hypothetical protein NC653_039975 [Populus alba x Populus x berolinensis]
MLALWGKSMLLKQKNILIEDHKVEHLLCYYQNKTTIPFWYLTKKMVSVSHSNSLLMIIIRIYKKKMNIVNLYFHHPRKFDTPKSSLKKIYLYMDANAFR